MNIIKILGICYKEDIISNMLVGLINESQNFRESFLSNIAGISKVETYEVAAFTRIGTSKGIPDIVVKVCNDEEKILLVIENKLKAEEGNEQTARYASEECLRELCLNKKINLEYKNISTKLVFLTLMPEQDPSGEGFVNKTYEDLLKEVNVEIEDRTLNEVYHDSLLMMEEFYSDIHVQKEDKLFTLLSEEVENEKILIRFKNIMKLITFDDDLKVRYAGKIGGAGRFSFAAKISKETWGGKEASKMPDGLYTVNEETFDIHLELSFDTNNKIIKIPLHYECNPYIPKGRLIKNSREEDYKKYLERRNFFKERMHEKLKELGDSSIKPYNGSNQVANISIKVDEDVRVKDFVEIIKENCKKISTLVDDVLSETAF